MNTDVSMEKVLARRPGRRAPSSSGDISMEAVLARRPKVLPPEAMIPNARDFDAFAGREPEPQPYDMGPHDVPDPFGVDFNAPQPDPGAQPHELLDRITAYRAQKQAGDEAAAKAGFVGRTGAAVRVAMAEGLAGSTSNIERLANSDAIRQRPTLITGRGWFGPDVAQTIPPPIVPSGEHVANEMFGVTPDTKAVAERAGLGSRVIAQAAALPTAFLDPTAIGPMLVSGGLHSEIKAQIAPLLAEVEKRAGIRAARAVGGVIEGSGGMGAFSGMHAAASYPNWDTDPVGGVKAVEEAVASGLEAGAVLGGVAPAAGLLGRPERAPVSGVSMAKVLARAPGRAKEASGIAPDAGVPKVDAKAENAAPGEQLAAAEPVTVPEALPSAADLRRMPIDQLRTVAQERGVDHTLSRGRMVKALTESEAARLDDAQFRAEPERLTNPTEKSTVVESSEVSTEIPVAADLRRMPMPELRAKAEEFGIREPGASKGLLVNKILDAAEERRAEAKEAARAKSKMSGAEAEARAGEADGLRDPAQERPVADRGDVAGAKSMVDDGVSRLVEGDRASAGRQSGDVGGVGDRLIAMADKWEQIAERRSKARGTIPRGRDVGASVSFTREAGDLAVRVAARAVRGGVKSARAVREVAEKVFAELAESGAKVGIEAEHVARIAHKIIKGATGKDGVIDPDAFDFALSEFVRRRGQRKGPGVRKTADLSAGVRSGEVPTIKQSDALSGQLRAEARGSRTGFRAGMMRAKAESEVRLNRAIERSAKSADVAERKALRSKFVYARRVSKDAYREGYKVGMAKVRERIPDLLERVKTKQGTKDSLREEAFRLAKENMPIRARGKVLDALRRATSLPRLSKAIERMNVETARELGRKDTRTLERYTGRGRMRKLDQESRDAINALGIGVSALREQLGSAESKTVLQAAERAQGLLQELTAIRHEYKRRNTVYFGEVRAKAAEVTDKVVSQLEKLPERPAGEVEGQPRRRGLFRELAFRFHLNNLQPQTVAALLDRDSVNRGPIRKLLYDSFTAAEGVRSQLQRNFHADVEKAVKAAGYDSLAMAQAETAATFGWGGVEKVEHTFGDGTKATLSKGQVMAVAAMDPQTRLRALRSGLVFGPERNGRVIKLAAEDFPALAAKLKPEDLRMIREVKEAFDRNLWGKMASTVRRLKGWEPEKVWGYFPSRRNMAKAERASEGLRSGHAAVMRHLENLGIVLDRTGGTTPYLVGDFWSVVWNHLDSSTALISYAEAVRSAELVMTNPKVKELIATRFGDRVNRWVDDYLVDASMVEHQRTEAGKWFRGLLGNVGKGVTQLNPRSWARNTLGVFTLMQDVGLRDWKAGLAGALKPGAWRKVLADSPYMWQRYHSQPFAAFTQVSDAPGMITGKEAGKVLRLAAKSLGQGRVVEAYRVGMRAFNAVRMNNYFDSLMGRVAWFAMENKASREVPNLKGAERAAWIERETAELMRNNANTYSRFDRSGWSAKADRNAFYTGLTMFRSDSNKRYNQVVMKWREMVQTGDPRPFLKVLAVNALVIGLSTYVIGKGSKYAVQRMAAKDGAGEQERRDALNEGAAWAFLEELAGTAFLGEGAVAVAKHASKFQSPSLNDDVLDTPVGGVADQMLTGLVDMYAGVDAKIDEMDETTIDPKLARRADRLARGFVQTATGAATMGGAPVAPMMGMVRDWQKGAAATHVGDLMYERRKLNKIPERKQTAAQRERLAELNGFYHGTYVAIRENAGVLRKEGDINGANRLEAELEEEARQFARSGSAPRTHRTARK